MPGRSGKPEGMILAMSFRCITTQSETTTNRDFYLVAPFVAVLGRTVTATRLPTAILGALTIWPLYLLVVEVIGKKKGEKIGLIAAGLWTFNIWQIDVSRATSEAVASCFLAILGLYFIAKCINQKGGLM